MPFASIPLAPLALGLAGLIPFWGLAIALLLHRAFGFHPGAMHQALAFYAAIILSFLGGIRWGFAVRAQDIGGQYALSVLPSLAAWAMLALPDPLRLVGLGLMALALGPFDLNLVRAGLAPAWFGRLRLILSTGAGTALLLGAATTLV